MTIPKSYEALAADLASEKIISKTLLGQKEEYMMLSDKGRLDLATWKQKACEAAEREAALREELEEYDEENSNLREVIRDIKNWREVSQSSAALSSLLKQADEIAHKPGPLQQRLTVAEQRALDFRKDLEIFVKCQLGINISDPGEDFVQTALRIFRMTRRLASELGIPEGENLESEILVFEENEHLQKQLAESIARVKELEALIVVSDTFKGVDGRTAFEALQEQNKFCEFPVLLRHVVYCSDKEVK